MQIKRIDLVKRAYKVIIEELVQFGAAVCQAAAESHETRRKTGNQENAYGYGVYVDGVLKKGGMARVAPAQGRARIKNLYYSGREELVRFFKSYHHDEPGITLVIANAMMYSAWQEEGCTPSGKVYRIISQIRGEMDNLVDKVMADFGLRNEDLERWGWTRKAY